MKRIIGALYIVISIALLGYGVSLIRERTTPILHESSNYETPRYTDSVFTILIPSANIELPAYAARITGVTWQTTKRGVSYLSTSPLPGEPGNSVLYGHNWSNLLGNLHVVKPGDPVYVTRGNTTTRFLIRYVAVVDSKESSVYAPSRDTRLTLYTCAGFLDRERLVVTAFPVAL